MTRDQLKERLLKISATPLRSNAPPRDIGRRETNFVTEEEDDEDMFETYFDFEEEILSIESARDQVEKLEKEEAQENLAITQESLLSDKEEEVVPEERSGDEDTFFAMDFDDEEESSVPLKDTPQQKPINKDNKGFQYKYCKYIKDDGERCKRQRPKKHDYCSAHRKSIKLRKEREEKTKKAELAN